MDALTWTSFSRSVPYLELSEAHNCGKIQLPPGGNAKGMSTRHSKFSKSLKHFTQTGSTQGMYTWDIEKGDFSKTKLAGAVTC